MIRFHGALPEMTEAAPAGAFWEAEPDHQNYLEHYPDGYSCHFVRSTWKLPVPADRSRYF